MVAQLIPERSFRGPGCSDACRVLRVFQPGVYGRRELLVHDPQAHETWGRIQAGDTGAARILTTGLLTIDREGLMVCVDGREISLTPTEWRLLLRLADRFDRVVSYTEIRNAIWPEWAADSSLRSDHLTSVNIARIRAKLGPDAGGLLETMKGFGLRLRVWPVGQPATPIKHYGPLTDGQWSHDHAACVNCGTTNLPHRSRGYCEGWRCRSAARVKGIFL